MPRRPSRGVNTVLAFEAVIALFKFLANVANELLTAKLAVYSDPEPKGYTDITANPQKKIYGLMQ